MSQEYSRRSFVKVAASALAAAPGVLGANERIQLGWIGTGTRGRYLEERAYAGNAARIKVVALCDTFNANLAQGKDVVQTKGQNTPKTYVDYRELLADKEVEAVVIATPEHLHHRMLLDAIAAGKNVYVEKPLAHTLEEAQEIMRAVAQSKSVIQVGTQNRSNSLYQMAKTMIAQGMIGDCHYVRAFWYRNAEPSGQGAWRYPIDPALTESNADWPRFLGPAKKVAFDPHRYRQWRLYWDYSSGIATDLMVHQTDITAFVLGRGIPSSVVATGGVLRWTESDDRDVPDTWSVLLDYPDQLHVNYSCYLGNSHFGYGEQYLGDDGTIEVLNRSTLNFFPEVYRPNMPEVVKNRKETTITIPGNDNLAVEAHIRNFLNAIRGVEKVIAPPQAGYEAAVPGFLSVMSYKQKKVVLWDAKADNYRIS